jgi:stage II sporulation protein AA (anti-sigma F factor antagonist)
MNLQVTSVEADTVFVRVEGEITPGAAGVAHDPLEKLIGPRGYSRTIVLNLQQVDYIDSSGIAWLLSWQRRTRQAGGSLGLCTLSPRVSEVLRISRMEQVLTIWPDEPAARAALAARGKQ